MKCTKCGNDKFHKHGFRLNVTGKKPLIQCKECGHTQINTEVK